MKRWASGVLAFITAAAVLVMEIIAARLLAPYVGVTLQTYTAIISIVLAGISGGAWLGGRAADKYDARTLLGPIIVLGGALSMASLAVVRTLGPHLRVGGALPALTLAGLAFFLPAAVLSMVSPMLVKLTLSGLDSAGRDVGRISALGTAGAIVGSFCTGFLFVSSTSSTVILIGLGVFLIVLGLIVFFALRPRSKQLIATTLVVAAVLGGCSTLKKSVCEVETAYYCARVIKDPDRASGRILVLDKLQQSYVDLNDPLYLHADYIQGFAAVADVIAPKGQPIKALHLGGGGFSIPSYVRQTRPNSENVVIERDPEVVKLDKKELGLVLGGGMSVVSDDGRIAVRHQPKNYWDVFYGDAFGGEESVPWHLTTKEFTQDIKDSLKSNGIYALNIIDQPTQKFIKAETRTVQAVFPYVAVSSTQQALDGHKLSNYVVLASNEPLPLDQIKAGYVAQGLDYEFVPADQLNQWVGNAQVLNDDYAPVDQLVHE